MVNVWDYVGRSSTPAAKLGSALISLITIGSMVLGLLPQEHFNSALTFLLFVIANNAFVYFKEMEVPVCHKCGAHLKPKITYQKHLCKK